jgi:hypothetical protein
MSSAGKSATPWLQAHVMAADDIFLALVLGVVAVAVGSIYRGRD